jgi:hypothetical protein
VLGCLPTIDLAEPWWMGTADLLAALRERFGLDGLVLRLVRWLRRAIAD